MRGVGGVAGARNQYDISGRTVDGQVKTSGRWHKEMDAKSDYDSDILAWSECQGGLLRRLAAGEGVNDQVDWKNVVEEVESVGRSDLHAVESLLTQALLHKLKAEAWPVSTATPGWKADARLYRRQAKRRFTPSMRQRIDVAGPYADAIAGLPDTIDGQPPFRCHLFARLPWMSFWRIAHRTFARCALS